MAKHNEIGALGEQIATDFLKEKGLEIIERNFWKPYGEIDIVARENDVTRFVEVKTVSYETGGIGDPTIKDGVPGETLYRPEENVDERKVEKLSRVISSYIISHETGDWEFDVISVFVDTKNKQAKIKWLKNLLLEE